MEESYEGDYLFKIYLAGDSGVGKSSVLGRFVGEAFSDKKATIDVEYETKTIDLDSKKVKFQIWDASGQLRFSEIASSYCRGARAVIAMFDISSQESFEHVDDWMNVRDEYAKDAKVFLVGNKSDLNLDRYVSEKDAKAKAEEIGATYFEVSALNDSNINALFNEVATQCFAELENKKAQEEHDKKKAILKGIMGVIDKKVNSPDLGIINDFNPYKIGSFYSQNGKIGFLGKLPTPIISIYNQCKDALDENNDKVTVESAIKKITEIVERKWLKTGCEDKWWYGILQAIRSFLSLDSKEFVNGLEAIDNVLTKDSVVMGK